MERVTVPFSAENFQLDLRATVTVRGVIRLEVDALVVEYRETRTSMDTLTEESGAVVEIRIPLSELDAVEWGRAWVRGGKLRIRTRTLAALENVPLAVGNELVLPIRRRDRMSARELAVNASLALSGLQLRHIQDGDESSSG